MGKSAPSPPPAPDPVATANAQAAANKESAIASQELSMVDQITPFGNLTYEAIGETAAGTPRYKATQTLDPTQQGILDQQTQAALKFGETANTQLSNVASLLENPVDYSGLGPAPTVNEETRTATRDAILQRLDPQFQRDRQALETSLVNQGFTVGTEGYNNAMDEYNRQRNDAYLAADIQAGNEMSRMFGLESSARDRAVNELIQQRSQPLNELSAMMSGTQVQGPQFVNTPSGQVNPADIMGATYGSANIEANNYAQRVANINARNQGFYDLLGTGAQVAGYAWSDRRLKKNIRKVGSLKEGLGLYLYEYIWGGGLMLGVMADEVKAVMPWAVRTVDGYDMVDYGALA